MKIRRTNVRPKEKIAGSVINRMCICSWRDVKYLHVNIYKRFISVLCPRAYEYVCIQLALIYQNSFSWRGTEINNVV